VRGRFISILRWQQKRRRYTVGVAILGLGDDPDFAFILEKVGRQQPAAVLQRLVVGIGVSGIDDAPIACDVANEKLQGSLSGPFQCLKSAWGCDDLAELEQRFFQGDHSSLLVGDVSLSGIFRSACQVQPKYIVSPSQLTQRPTSSAALQPSPSNIHANGRWSK
jgi:hypothetical protein